MKMKPILYSLVLAAGVISPTAAGRTWTSSDGSKTFEGELQSYDSATGKVTVILANRKRLSFAQDKLSAEDIAWLKKNGNRAGAGGGSSTKVGELPDVLPDPDGEEADMS